MAYEGFDYLLEKFQKIELETSPAIVNHRLLKAGEQEIGSSEEEGLLMLAWDEV